MAEPTTAPARGRLRGTLRAVLGVVSALFLAAMVALLLALVVVPRVVGGAPYTVLSGSMEPTYAPGDVVVTRPVDFDDIRTGDAITYQLRSGDPTLVTHRVVGAVHMPGGETRYVTQGDANDVADAEPVREVQVRGRVWYSVPLIGYLNAWLTGPTRTVVVHGAAGLLLAYAAYQLVVSFRRREPRPASEEPARRPVRPDPVEEGA